MLPVGLVPFRFLSVSKAMLLGANMAQHSAQGIGLQYITVDKHGESI